MRYYLHVGGVNAFRLSYVFIYLADVMLLWGLWMLWRTLRDLARHPASPDPLAQYPPQPGVWPPPPTVPTANP